MRRSQSEESAGVAHTMYPQLDAGEKLRMIRIPRRVHSTRKNSGREGQRAKPSFGLRRVV